MYPYPQQQAYPVGQPVPQPGQSAQQSGAVSPEVMQAFMQLESQKNEQAKLQRQMQQSQALRTQGMQTAQATPGGSLRVGAPNWAGTLANVYAAKKGSDLQRDADARSDASDQRRQDALRRYFEALSGQQRAAPQQSYMGEEGE